MPPQDIEMDHIGVWFRNNSVIYADSLGDSCIELVLTVFLSPLYIVLLRMVTKLSQIPDQELPRRTGRKRMKRPPTAEDNVGEPDEEEESDHHDDAPGVADSASLKQHLHLATLGEEQRRQRPEVRALKRVCHFDSI